MVCHNYQNPVVPIALSPSGVASSLLNVPHGGQIMSVSVEPMVSLNYTSMQNLNLELRSPAGTTITLLNSSCSAGGMQLGFKDNAAQDTPVGCPSGEDLLYKPQQPLSNFNGQNQRGQWTLRVVDVGSRPPGAGTPAPTNTPLANPAATGQLTGWGLRLCVINFATATPPPPAATHTRTPTPQATSTPTIAPAATNTPTSPPPTVTPTRTPTSTPVPSPVPPPTSTLPPGSG
jgi:hypothetical protein